ncbi:MAG: sugar transferase [Candidatus Limnocylindrales bacterium]
MIRRYIAVLHLGLMVADGVIAAAVFMAVSAFRFGAEASDVYWTTLGIEPVAAAILYAAVLVAVLWVQHLYQLRVRWSPRREALDVLVAIVLLAVVVFTALFLLKLPAVSRLFLILLFPTQAVVTIATRTLIRLAFVRVRSRGYNLRFVLVVGANQGAQAFADAIERHRDLGLRVVGHLAGPADLATGAAATVTRPVIADIDDIETVLHERVVDEVAICLSADDRAHLEPVARLCEDEGRIVRIPQTEPGMFIPGGRVEDFLGTPMLSLVYGPDRTIALFAKRLIDVVLATIGLIVLAPVFGAFALAIIAADGRPVLFRQVRVGLHGRPFTIVKFRTMVKDAEARYAEVQAMSDTRGAAFKMKDDPRVTRIGRLLRKTSVDELPQLWNVLLGEMSIVGPRPAPPREVADYDVWHRRRLSMKPGITGLWQVEARFDEDFDHRAQLDLSYIDRWSLLLDVQIIVKTIPALVLKPGS